MIADTNIEWLWYLWEQGKKRPQVLPKQQPLRFLTRCPPGAAIYLSEDEKGALRVQGSDHGPIG